MCSGFAPSSCDNTARECDNIAFPGFSDDGDFGESSLDNAIPWAQIKPASYSPSAGLDARIPRLLAKHEARTKVDKDFKYLQEDISEFKLQRKNNEMSLNEAERRRQRDAREALLANRETRDKESKIAQGDADAKDLAQGAVSASRDDGLQSNERNLAKELAAEKVRKNAKDIFLIEAAHILSDEVGLLAISPRFADSAKPVSYAIPE